MTIELRDVAMRFEGREVFSGVSCTFGPGLTLLRSPSGGGKTTLLRLLNRLAEPSEGTVLHDGRPWPARELPGLRRTAVLVPQKPLATGSSVREELLAGFRLGSSRGAPIPTDDVLADELAGLGLEGADLDRQASELSVGQMQRVGLLRAILLRPRALFLDEPTASLDEESTRRVVERVASLDATVVVASHQGEQWSHAATRRMQIEGGRLR